MSSIRQREWWGHPAFLLLIIFLSGAPLWWPSIPPLTDLLGHMGRYAVQLDGGRSPALARYYHLEWHWLGNLGVDLLVQLMGPLLGVEAASKAIAILIPMLTSAGFLLAAREVHGRLPPTAFFALPLAWSYPYLWGFVNFALAMALAFLSFALWLRLARQGKLRVRFWLFVPISLLVWTAHIYGWAALCVLIGCAELWTAGPLGRGMPRRLVRAIQSSLCLLPPLALLLWQFRQGGAGGQPLARLWFKGEMKQRWLESILRDRWEIYDKASLFMLFAVVVIALGFWAWVRRRPNGGPLLLAAITFAALFAILPHALVGSAYADMRLAPYALATALLAIGPVTNGGGIIAALGLLFWGVRTIGTTVSMAAYDQSYRSELVALRFIPSGARLLSFVGRPCSTDWAVHRLDHLPSLALVRRHAFANDQWQATGAQLISVRYAEAGPFRADPSQFVVESRCARPERRAFPEAMALIPQRAFDFVWIIRQPAEQADMRGLQPVWRQGSSALYRVTKR